ncbi:MAG: hypothetical protein KC454_05750 [Flavobacteriales bacterium]|nr:hypothetical protein [Flavobacteriales bacterium]
MKNFIFLFAILLISNFVQGQKKNQPGLTMSEMKDIKLAERKAAKEAIYTLSEGVLLVRLNFKNKEINYYEKHENTKAAERLKKEQAKHNVQIIKAFRDLYTFSPVYFFGMNDSESVLTGKFNDVTFYDDKALPSESIKLNSKDFLIAEFGMVERDTSNSEGATTSLSALVVRSNDFVQLRDPFPFYSAYTPFGKVKKRYRMPVLRLQRRLTDYYRSAGQ